MSKKKWDIKRYKNELRWSKNREAGKDAENRRLEAERVRWMNQSNTYRSKLQVILKASVEVEHNVNPVWLAQTIGELI